MKLRLLPILAIVFYFSTALAHTEISASVAHGMIAADESLVVLDVREYSEFCGSVRHIRNAASLPWSSGVLQARVAELPTDVKIIVVCASGGRAHLAANFLDGEGFTQVFDMAGGMSAWAWEKEVCGVEPALSLDKAASGTGIDWSPVTGSQDYDLLRGVPGDIADAGTFVDLGVTDCLADDSPFTAHTDSPAPPGDRFYLVRQREGDWGQSSARVWRLPADPDCD